MSDFKTFDLDIWSEPDEKHRVSHIGMKNGKETFDNLENHLNENDLLPDEYFLCDFRNFEDDCPLPDYDEAICHTNFGSSEGIYIDIFLKRYEDDKVKYVRFATGKTLGETADDFFKNVTHCGGVFNSFKRQRLHATKKYCGRTYARQ